MALETLKKVNDSENKNNKKNNKKSDKVVDMKSKSNTVPETHYENKPELIWENMQMIAFNNKIFLKLA